MEVIDLLGNRIGAELGVAFFVACYHGKRALSPIENKRDFLDVSVDITGHVDLYGDPKTASMKVLGLV